LLEVGKGNFGEVWLGRINGTDNVKTKYAAIKISKDDWAKRHLFNEYKVMKAI
jgi:predicted Ser/Thr protein kinase